MDSYSFLILRENTRLAKYFNSIKMLTVNEIKVQLKTVP